jgi:hypothetical protein
MINRQSAATDFYNKIGQKRTHASQQKSLSITSLARASKAAGSAGLTTHS